MSQQKYHTLHLFDKDCKGMSLTEILDTAFKRLRRDKYLSVVFNLYPETALSHLAEIQLKCSISENFISIKLHSRLKYSDSLLVRYLLRVKKDDFIANFDKYSKLTDKQLEDMTLVMIHHFRASLQYFHTYLSGRHPRNIKVYQTYEHMVYHIAAYIQQLQDVIYPTFMTHLLSYHGLPNTVAITHNEAPIRKELTCAPTVLGKNIRKLFY